LDSLSDRATSSDPIDPSARFRLDGKVASSRRESGIGARFARVLDALGATVVVSADAPTASRRSPPRWSTATP